MPRSILYSNWYIVADPRKSSHAAINVALRPLPSGASDIRNSVFAASSGDPKVPRKVKSFEDNGDAMMDTFSSDCETPRSSNLPTGPKAASGRVLLPLRLWALEYSRTPERASAFATRRA